VIGYLGLGSNIGDRRVQLAGAVQALERHGVSVIASSSVYETEPVGEVPDQRDFYNACLKIETDRTPEDLLAVCKAVERELGRDGAGVRHGPRSIDVDLLLLGSIRYESSRLALPHRDIVARRFVLVPLLELDPELELPGDGRLADALEDLGPGQDVRRVGAPLLPR
jgi:2-amino-4-hydroxy-6-hydroxymethyldihydropteridine diphosphokinase